MAGVRLSIGSRDFNFSTSFTPALGRNAVSFPMATKGLSLGIERPGREADLSPPSSGECKNVGAVPPLTNTAS
jgi:hypothetical protein